MNVYHEIQCRNFFLNIMFFVKGDMTKIVPILDHEVPTLCTVELDFEAPIVIGKRLGA